MRWGDRIAAIRGAIAAGDNARALRLIEEGLAEAFVTTVGQKIKLMYDLRDEAGGSAPAWTSLTAVEGSPSAENDPEVDDEQ